MNRFKLTLRTLKRMFFLLFFLIGLYQAFMFLQFKMVQGKVEEIESKRNYDKDFWYYEDGGQPLILTNEKFNKTIFFMEGFRTQSPAGMYEDWFKKIHKEYRVNIIVPVYGLQSSPFHYRNRDWSFREDLRTVTQIYDSYTSILPKKHKVYTISQSFGTLPHSAILAKSKRKPDYSIYLSPLNTGMEFKAAGPVIYWLSKQTWWLRRIALFSFAAPAPGRASVWDIVNKEKNLKMAARGDVNPEDSSELGYQSEVAAKWMEDNLIPLIQNRKILVVWGDSDLYFSQKGYNDFSDKIKSYGNNVDTLTLEKSGHMVLLDNGEDILKSKIIEIIK